MPLKGVLTMAQRAILSGFTKASEYMSRTLRPPFDGARGTEILSELMLGGWQKAYYRGYRRVLSGLTKDCINLGSIRVQSGFSPLSIEVAQNAIRTRVHALSCSSKTTATYLES